MLKRKNSTDSESSAKTPRLQNIPDYKYTKLSEILPDYDDLIHSPPLENAQNSKSGDASPMLAQIDGVTHGVFLPSAFLEYMVGRLDSVDPKFLDETGQKLKQIIGRILSYKSYDFESDDISRKSSVDSTDYIHRGLLRPDFESLHVGQITNGDGVPEVCEDYAAVMGMRPQMNPNSEMPFILPNLKTTANSDKTQNTSEDSEMSEGITTRSRRGSYGGQKGIYGSYARKIEAIHRRNEEDIKNIMEATLHKSNEASTQPTGAPNAQKKVFNDEKLHVENNNSTQKTRVSKMPHPYGIVSNGLVQAVPIMHPGPLQYFIHVPMAQGPYIAPSEIDVSQSANCIPGTPPFPYPQMQFLHINPFMGQSAGIAPNIKQEDNLNVSENGDSALPTSTE